MDSSPRLHVDSNAVVGWWFTVVQNFADKGELVQANFKQGGGIEWSLITEVHDKAAAALGALTVNAL